MQVEMIGASIISHTVRSNLAGSSRRGERLFLRLNKKRHTQYTYIIINI